MRSKNEIKITGEKLKGLREKKSMTQEQLADALGLEAGTISKWETGAQDMGKKSLARIASYFDVTMDYLMSSDSTESFWKVFASSKKAFVANLSTYADFDLADVYKEIQDMMQEECPELLNKLSCENASDNIEMIPVVNAVACAGHGNGYAEIEWQKNDYYPVEKKAIMGHCWRATGFKIIGISGDSMEPRFFDEDKILFVEGEDVNSGDVVVVWWDNRLYIRGYLDNGDQIKLKPLNRKYPDIEINKEDERFYLLGKVIARIPPIEMVGGFF